MTRIALGWILVLVSGQIASTIQGDGILAGAIQFAMVLAAIEWVIRWKRENG